MSLIYYILEALPDTFKKNISVWKRFHKLKQFQYKVNTNLLINVENIRAFARFFLIK